jgi:hypothetical protein
MSEAEPRARALALALDELEVVWTRIRRLLGGDRYDEAALAELQARERAVVQRIQALGGERQMRLRKREWTQASGGGRSDTYFGSGF